jgi:hypothetical protein
MIKHIVFFKFKPELSESDRDKVIEELKTLPEKIDFIRSFEAGLDLIRSPRSWDGALIETFDDLDALNLYQRHDDHIPIIEMMRQSCDAIGSVDFEY